MVAKGKRLTRRRSPQRRLAGRQTKIMEVRSASEIPALESLLSKGPMTLVLVFADWCPACHRFMKGLWKPMCKEQEGSGAAMNRVAVREDLVGKTSLSGAQYKYLPSLMLVGTDKRPAVFESPEGKTNAMPTPQTLDELKRISNVSPSDEASGSNSNEQSSDTQPAENLSPLEPNVFESDEIPRPLNNTMKLAQKGGCGCMMRGGGSSIRQNGGGSCSACALQTQMGGGLYSSLMAVARGAIPATTLAIAASAIKKPHVLRKKTHTRRKGAKRA